MLKISAKGVRNVHRLQEREADPLPSTDLTAPRTMAHNKTGFDLFHVPQLPADFQILGDDCQIVNVALVSARCCTRLAWPQKIRC